jgi:hypothetical protein
VIAAAPYAHFDASLGALYVFTQPTGGWSGLVHQRAEIDYYFQDGDLGPSLAFSGGTVAAVKDLPSGHECPCGGVVYASREPSQGWSGATAIGPSASNLLTVDGLGEIATDGHSIAVGGYGGVYVFEILIPPHISQTAIAGLATDRPRLNFSLIEAADQPLLKSFTVSLPGGLSFSKNHERLTRGVSIAGLRGYRLGFDHGHLTVALRDPARRLKVTITAPALAESTQLISNVDAVINHNRGNKRHAKKKLTLKLTVGATDTDRDTTPLAINIIVE